MGSGRTKRKQLIERNHLYVGDLDELIEVGAYYKIISPIKKYKKMISALYEITVRGKTAQVTVDVYKNNGRMIVLKKEFPSDFRKTIDDIFYDVEYHFFHRRGLKKSLVNSGYHVARFMCSVMIFSVGFMYFILRSITALPAFICLLILLFLSILLDANRHKIYNIYSLPNNDYAVLERMLMEKEEV